VSDVTVVDRPDLGGEAIANMQQNRRDQRNQAKRMVEYHQPTHVRIPQQTLRTPKQPSLQTTVYYGRAINFLGRGRHRRRLLGVTGFDELADFTDNLRNEFDRSASVVMYIAINCVLACHRLQIAIDVGGRWHDRIVRLQRNQDKFFAVEHRRRRIGRPEIYANANPHRSTAHGFPAGSCTGTGERRSHLTGP